MREIEEAALTVWLPTGRRSAPLERKYSHSHDPDDGRFISANEGEDESGDMSATPDKARSGAASTTRSATTGRFDTGAHARLTPPAKTFAERINAELHARTGKNIHINNGTRESEFRADAMIKKGLFDWSTYRDKRANAEIRAACDRSATAGADRTG